MRYLPSVRRRRRPGHRTLGRTIERFGSKHFERLEDRRLLAVGVLGTSLLETAPATIDEPDEIGQFGFSLVGGGESSVVAFRVWSDDGGLFDPAVPSLQDAGGSAITPVLAVADGGGGHDSLLLAELTAGTYQFFVGGEAGTTGSFVVGVLLVGDLDGDGRVLDSELLMATAALVQGQGSGNHLTARLFHEQGIDLSGNLYHVEIDANWSGGIDRFDIEQVQKNVGLPVLQSTLVSLDTVAPAIAVQLRSDTGRDDLPETFTDGITHEVTGNVIVGTLTDDSAITFLRAMVDNADPLDFDDVPLGADGRSFTLTLADLRQLAGGATLENNGPHTLFLVAEDALGNATTTPVEFTFEFDTTAPAAPTNLDLTDASDSREKGDNITSDSTPTITADAESGTLVVLAAGDLRIGQAVAGSPVSITTQSLADDVYTITATSTDRAGNRSPASGTLIVEIDTVPPVVDSLDLAEASDTGEIGDQFTSLPIVTLAGTTEPGMTVVLPAELKTTTADAATGQYAFNSVSLAFGATSYRVEYFDLAGNQTVVTKTFTRDSDPEVDQPVTPVVVDEDAAAESVDLSAAFTDADFLDNQDRLTLAVIGNTNPALVTTALSDANAANRIDNDRMTLAFAANANGSAAITLRATDTFGRTAVSTIQVTVRPVNDGPVANDDTVLTNQDVPVAIAATSLLANDTDLDGNTLSITAVTQPAHGALVDNGDGTYTYTPADGFVGADSFTYTLADGQGGTDTAAVNITVFPPNNAPVAANDSSATSEDIPLSISAASLLANDTDADGDTLSISGFTQPAHGVLVDNGNGTFTYTPNGDFNGTDSFTYTVTDGKAGADTATVSITVSPVNDAPVAANNTVATAEDTALSISAASLLANDTDVDGDTLSISGFTQPAHGVLVDNGNGTFTYTPNGNFNGTDSFTYTATDGKGGTGTATVQITVTAVNDAPVAGDDSVSASEETPRSISKAILLTNDTDVDGDTLSISGFTQPAHGVLVDNGDGTFTYTPTGDFVGADSFTYTLADGQGGADTATVQITVGPANDAPVAANDSSATAEDTALSISAASLLANDTDVDGDTLSIGGFTQPAHGVLVDNGNGTFTYTPTGNFNGTDSFTYTATDGKGGTDTATVSITVSAVNDAPVAANNTASTAEDTALSISAASLLANDTDVDGDTLSISGFTQPAHGALVDNGNGTFTYTPNGNFNGTDSFTYTVADGHGGAATATVSVTVTPVNDAPVNTVPSAQATAAPPPLIFSSAGGNLIAVTDVDADGGTLQVTLTATDGTLTLAGTAGLTFSAGDGVADATMTFTGTIAAINTALNGLAFDPAPASIGVGTVQITTNDRGNTGSGGARSDTDSITLLMSGVINDPPVNTVPGPQTTASDTALVFSGAHGNAITIADVDAGNNAVQVSLTATNGTLTLAGTAGLSFSQGDGQADAAMTFTGTISAINTALGGTVFNPTPGFAGDASVQIVTNDLGRVGSGGAKTDTDSILITVEGPLVQFVLTTTNLTGNAISTVAVGEDFLLKVFVQDLRPDPPTVAGVGAAYLDVTYNAALASVVTGTLDHGSHYTAALFGSTAPGLIDEVGGFYVSSPPLGDGAFLVFSVQLTADGVGLLTFAADPADVLPNRDVVFSDPADRVPSSRIIYGTTTVNVAAGVTAASSALPDGNGSVALSVTPASAVAVTLVAASGGPAAGTAVAATVALVDAETPTVTDLPAVVATSSGDSLADSAASPGGDEGTDAVATGVVGLSLEPVLAVIAADVSQAWAEGAGLPDPLA